MFLSGTVIQPDTAAVVQDQATLERLAAQWNTLADRFKTPLVRHEWFLACAEAFCPPGKLSVFVTNDHETTSAIAPCAWMPSGGGGRFEILGSSIHTEPTGMLYADEQAFSALLRTLLAQHKPVRLTRMPKEDLIEDTVQTLCSENECFVIAHASSSPWLPIESNWNAFESSMTSSRRNSLRRSRKHAALQGDVFCEFLSPRPEEVDRLLQTLVCVEASGWKGKRGTAIAQLPHLKKFFSSYARVTALQGKLVLGFLRIGNRPVAALFGVLHENRFWLLKTGYDEAWAHCSPGIMLLHESIRWAFEKGLEAYEFLGYDEPWIRMWTEHVHRYTSYYIYPRSLHGAVNLGIDATQVLGGKLLSMLRSNT